MGQVLRMPKKGVTLRKAVDAFISQPDLAPTTERSYRHTLAVVLGAVGSEMLIAELDPVQVQSVLEQLWGNAAPATWNRQVATLRSFLSYCRRRSWLADATLEAKRRREHEDRTRSIPPVDLDRLWRRSDVALRDKALWRLLHESAARATEVLSLNVEDVDVANKRARIRSKGGAIELIHFQTGSARLLPRLIAGRSCGPLFLADRRPTPARAPATVDIDPETGRARLSYRRAEEIFRAATGWTLHQLRHFLCHHAPGREQRRSAPAHGQVPPRLAALAPALRPPRHRGRRRPDCRPRSSPPTPLIPACSGRFPVGRVRKRLQDGAGLPRTTGSRSGTCWRPGASTSGWSTPDTSRSAPSAKPRRRWRRGTSPRRGGRTAEPCGSWDRRRRRWEARRCA